MFPCPHCGGDVPGGRNACPHCGASDADGWNDEDAWDEEDEFDYDEFVEREFGGQRNVGRRRRRPGSRAAGARRWTAWLLVAVFALALLLPLLSSLVR